MEGGCGQRPYEQNLRPISKFQVLTHSELTDFSIVVFESSCVWSSLIGVRLSVIFLRSDREAFVITLLMEDDITDARPCLTRPLVR